MQHRAATLATTTRAGDALQVGNFDMDAPLRLQRDNESLNDVLIVLIHFVPSHCTLLLGNIQQCCINLFI